MTNVNDVSSTNAIENLNGSVIRADINYALRAAESADMRPLLLTNPDHPLDTPAQPFESDGANAP